MQCVNKNTREYQTLLKLSGLSDFELSVYVGKSLDDFGRYPCLDELPRVNSSKAISEDLSLNKDNITKTENILLATNTNTVEEAVPVLNDKYRDKEIEVLEIGSKSKVYITTRPSTTQNQDGETDKQIKIASEMADIKERALINGTFMKAPNGKPTNLTERQWLQVRTKAFKKWFGDWEKLAPKLQVSDDKKLQDILQNIASSNSRFSTLAKFILDNHLSTRDLGELLIDKDFPLANQQGWYREIDDPQVGIIRYIGFQANNVPEETFNGAILHEIMHSLTQRLLKNYKENPNSVPENIRASIKDLYDIIDYSKKYILDNYNLKEGSDREKLLSLVKRQNFDKGYLHKMFYAFDETANPESRHIDEFISEIFTNPAFQEMLNSIPYKETKQTLWDKIKECIQNIFGIPINRGSVLEEALKASTEFITKAKEDYDSVSKVVDENGEPLIVWHGSKESNKINIFYNIPTYFADKYTALSYTPFDAEDETEYMYPVFLNIRNPKQVDGNGAYWSNINGMTTKDIVKSISEEEDGVIIENIKDYGDFAPGNPNLSLDLVKDAPLHTDYITTDPNQIKSATDNNGLFSSSNNNINDDYENVNSFAFFNEIIDKLQTLYGINIIPITNTELSQDRWASITGTKGVKSFIYNGNIYINTDIATVDSPVHEFLHLLFGSMKYLNRALYDLLVGQAELFDSYNTIAQNYPNRTRGDINEEVFVTELAKYLTGQKNAISNLDLSILNEIIYNVNRTLDTVLMGENSVKCVENPYIMNLKTLAKLVNSSTMISEKRGSLSDATLNRMMANTKSELMKNKELKEECQ